MFNSIYSSNYLDMIKMCGVKDKKGKTRACVVKHISSGHWLKSN